MGWKGEIGRRDVTKRGKERGGTVDGKGAGKEFFSVVKASTSGTHKG